MLFHSYLFILFFLPLFVLCYFLAGRYRDGRAAIWVLDLFSLWFLASQGLGSLLVFAACMAANYGIAGWITQAKEKRIRKLILVIGIGLNIGVLFFFKYTAFLVENVNAVFGSSIPVMRIFMPVGISFYTFQHLMYLIDSYQKGDQGYSPLQFATYDLFFPKMLQGPITRCEELAVPLFAKGRRSVSFENLGKGLYGFSLGLAKKVLLADNLAKIVNVGYADVAQLGSADAVIVMICYSLQIYFDFSGYCDMAEGIGRMIGIRLPVNFKSPYQAVSISDFWDRWHITLTRFFTRYLYIPLGGSRKGKGRTLINIMIVFCISGLWHGANWTFIVWGAFNGLCMVFERAAGVEKWKLPRAVRMVTAFIVTTFAWSIFRAQSLSQAVTLWSRLFAGGGRLCQGITEAFYDIVEMAVLQRAGAERLLSGYSDLLLYAVVFVLVLACFVMKNTGEKVEAMKFSLKKAVVTAGLLLWGLFSLAEISSFIYVNF